MIKKSIVYPQTTSYRFGQGWVVSILPLSQTSNTI